MMLASVLGVMDPACGQVSSDTVIAVTVHTDLPSTRLDDGSVEQDANTESLGK